MPIPPWRRRRENALSVIQKQVRRLRISGIPVDLTDRFVDVPVDYDQVQLSVQVEIDETRSRSPDVLRDGWPDTRAQADVFVCAPAACCDRAPPSRCRSW